MSQPIYISKKQHSVSVQKLPVYEIVHEWLEKQPAVNVDGCLPVDVLQRLLEMSALFCVGNAREQEEMIDEIMELLQ